MHHALGTITSNANVAIKTALANYWAFGLDALKSVEHRDKKQNERGGKMPEIKNVINKTVGYSFSITIEREVRTETGAKYPDKQITKASVGGHGTTLDDVTKQLEAATEVVKKQVKEG